MNLKHCLSLKRKILTSIETALFVPENYLKIAKEYADEFIVDIKIPEDDLCKSLLGGNVDQYLNNLKHLDLKTTTLEYLSVSILCERIMLI